MTEARMQETPGYAPGTFCWVELATTNSESAKKFYSGLFGWTPDDKPMGSGMVYTMMNLGGKNAAALYQMEPERLAQNIPPHWVSYVSVAWSTGVGFCGPCRGRFMT